MCGIAGVISWCDALHKQMPVFGQMQRALLRRGPDQRGLCVDGAAALIHTRLCVIDPEHGQQPMQAQDDREQYTILYNGELYNTQELRGALTGAGHTFRTHADTEVLLHAYMEWGEDCLARLNGIFAFAVWEHRRERLFLARDRIGVKPLFYHLSPERLVFASELGAVLAHPEVPHEIGIEGISQLLLFGPGRTPGCGVFEGMKELRPAHCAVYTREGGWEEHCYWQLTAQAHPDNFEQTAEHVRYLLCDAIERQLGSDVPVGTFLSGGLDSSLISSVASRYFAKEGRTLPTFSVDYRDNDKYFKASRFQPNSDPAYIRQMTDYLQSDHHWTLVDTPELVAALYDAAQARGLPGMADVDASLLLLCRDIKSHVTVALSGECADEIFGGYPWYRDPEIRAAYGFPWSQCTAYRMTFAQPEVAEILRDRQDVDTAYQATLARTQLLPGESPTEERMRQMMRLNLDWFMQTLLEGRDIKGNGVPPLASCLPMSRTPVQRSAFS